MAEAERRGEDSSGRSPPRQNEEELKHSGPTATEELLPNHPSTPKENSAEQHQDSSAMVMPTPLDYGGFGRASSPSSSANGPPGGNKAEDEEHQNGATAALLRSPSVLSEGTSNRPDPPSVVGGHPTVVDYDWVQEFLPRGSDAAETGSSSRGNNSNNSGTAPGGEPAADERPLPTNPLLLHEYESESRVHTGPNGDATPMFISVPSLDDRDRLRDADRYYDESDVGGDYEDDVDNLHHLKRVESLLREDNGGLAGSPLPSVLEHEELVVNVAPPPPTEEAVSNKEGTATGNSINSSSSAAEDIIDHADRSSHGTSAAPSEELSRSKPSESVPSPYRPSIALKEAKVYDAPPLGQRFGPDDDVALMPRIEERVASSQPLAPAPQAGWNPSLSLEPPARFQYRLPGPAHGFTSFNPPTATPILVRGGRRKIRLRLQEETRSSASNGGTAGGKSRRSLLGHLRTRSQQMMWGSRDFKNKSEVGDNSNPAGEGRKATAHPSSEAATNSGVVERGSITVSWFDGTSAIELQEHVRTSVLRKLGLEKNVDLADMRILDESTDPPEEIVLSPHIPDGSQFLLRYSTRDSSTDGTVTPLSIYSGRAPDSPSAEPSPRTGRLVGDLNANQLALLRRQLNALKLPQAKDVSVDEREVTKSYRKRTEEEKKEDVHIAAATRSPNHNAPNGKVGTGSAADANREWIEGEAPVDDPADDDNNNDNDLDHNSSGSKVMSELEDDYDDMMLHSEDPIEARLRQITELLILDRQKKRSKYSSHKREKRQVIFVLANYFVLFLSLIAISAEIQARAPGWLLSLESQLKNVQDCAADKDALFQCVSNGDFAGLVASILLYLSRSVATRRFFLFGFETPKKLWTVVYESLVTSVCWGFSYLFIRRGMNPDTRPQFVQKYWKDAVYGSLAGFNAAFMKHVLKNLIPQEAVEDVLRERQLKILSWLPSFHG